MDKEMLTVKEWAQKAGIKLYNYDGFLNVYIKLMPEYSDFFPDNTTIRFKAAGDLLCTREAFELYLQGCSMNQPRMNELEKISEILPYFIEEFINSRLSSIISYNRHNVIKPEKAIEEIRKIPYLLTLKLNARAKSIELEPTYTIDIINIRDEELKEKLKKYFHNRVQTVEKAELLLSENIAKEIEKKFMRYNLKISKTLMNNLSMLTELFFESARYKRVHNKDNEFMLVTSTLKRQSEESKSYDIIEENEIKEKHK